MLPQNLSGLDCKFQAGHKKMYLIIEDNVNCGTEERVFAEKSKPQEVIAIQTNSPQGLLIWAEIVGVDEGGKFIPAQGVLVDDSGAGSAWLIYGGPWGIRCRTNQDEWSLTNKAQWGLPFKVLDSSGEDVRFKPAS